MIEQPLSDKKRDYWATIFQTVMPDDNSGECNRKTQTYQMNIDELIINSFHKL